MNEERANKISIDRQCIFETFNLPSATQNNICDSKLICKFLHKFMSMD